MSNASISHKGVITAISENIVSVSITNMSACSSCHAKGACNASDMQEKVIDATVGGKQFSIGDKVTVMAKESMGFKALFLGYVFPFILVLITLIVATAVSINEARAGLLALFSLVPYYSVLYFTKNKIKKSFIFEIQ